MDNHRGTGAQEPASPDDPHPVSGPTARPEPQQLAPPTAADEPEGERRRGELSPREREVLRLLAAGQTDQQIATALGVSYRTVTTHVGRLFTKLGVRSRAAAAAEAVRRGLA